ncbi:MAG: hypothetical protein WCY27_04170 [archaeon]
MPSQLMKLWKNKIQEKNTSNKLLKYCSQKIIKKEKNETYG